MKEQELDKLILDLIAKSGIKGLTFGELKQSIGNTRKEKAHLSETLNKLMLDGTIYKELKRYKAKEKKSEPRVNIQESSNHAKQDYHPSFIEGKFDATPLSRDRSFAFVRTEEKDYFIDSEECLNAFHNDTVLIDVLNKDSYNERAIVKRILKRANEEFTGTVARLQNRWIFIPSNPKIHKWFNISEIGEAKPDYIVVLKVENWGDPLSGKPPIGKIIEVLGESGDPEVELMAVIRQYNLSLQFPDEVLAELNTLKPQITPYDTEKRRDLRELFTFTIDPISAKDFDDAISIEKNNQGFRLYVHIADVANYVPINSETFKEAANRGNSFYFPKKVIPMLPEILSNSVCSLRPNEDKLCLTVESTFDNEGRIQKQNIYESIIRSDARLSYEEVDAVFENRPSSLSPMLIKALDNARQLSALLTKHRLKQGYIFFDLPEIEYQYDEEGFINKLDLSQETESHKLIENFMLVANEFVATSLTMKNKGSLYRIHEDPDKQKIERMAETLFHYGILYLEKETLNKSVQNLLYSLPDKEYHKVFDRIILRSLKKAKYSTEHIRHFGLSIENYTHFTSPIRRLCDLVIHHLCKIHLIGSSKESISKEQLKHWASVAFQQELSADNAERDIERVYRIAFMKDKINESFTGCIISTNSSSAIVLLNEIPITAVLTKDQFGPGIWEYREQEMRFINKRNGKVLQLMDQLKVNILEVSDDVYLMLSNDKDAHLPYPRLPILKPKEQRQKRIIVDAKPRSKKIESKSDKRSIKKGRR